MKMLRSYELPTDAKVAYRLIRAHCRLGSPPDIVRAALSSYAEILEAVDVGYAVDVVDKEGRRWPFAGEPTFSYPGLEKAELYISPEGNLPRTLLFDAETARIIDKLKAQQKARTNAEVIRKAVQVFAKLLLVVVRMNDRIVIRVGGVDVPYHPFAPFELSQFDREPSRPFKVPSQSSRAPGQS